MKIHNATENSPLILAFLQVFRLSEDQQVTENIEEADLIMTTSDTQLRALYAKYGDTKFIILLDPKQDTMSASEDNIFSAGSGQLMDGVMDVCVKAVEKYKAWSEKQKEQPKKVERPEIGDLIYLSKSYKVLVIDDKQENLQTAAMRLVGQQIILVSSPAEALELLKLDDKLEKPSIDAVLTDLNMKPDKMYPALNLSRYGLSDEVPAGISIMFEATKRGLPVAIVTDANHHQDWFSAMFDHMKDATVNGQKVIFCQEGGGKRWDVVLKNLMEEET